MPMRRAPLSVIAKHSDTWMVRCICLPPLALKNGEFRRLQLNARGKV